MKTATTRFFSYLNLFMFFMLVLVLAANLLLMFVGWEGVGLCSYLLVGFYFKEKFAADAANKAFIVNRIGDFGFSLAIFLTVVLFGTLDFGRIAGVVAGMPVETSAHMLTAITLLFFLGAAGKSAQFPLIRLVAGRHGRTDSGLCLDSRRHHGDRGCLYDCPRIVPL